MRHTFEPEGLSLVGNHFIFDYPAQFTTLPDYTAHAGQPVLVLRQTPDNDTDVPMFRVRALDGWEGDAWLDELRGTEGAPDYFPNPKE